jgi:hypothetical protein
MIVFNTGRIHMRMRFPIALHRSAAVHPIEALRVRESFRRSAARGRRKCPASGSSESYRHKAKLMAPGLEDFPEHPLPRRCAAAGDVRPAEVGEFVLMVRAFRCLEGVRLGFLCHFGAGIAR